jgi:2,3,4,5-tetrahydropyridine-2-carboxylate N-succinyltransferase
VTLEALRARIEAQAELPSEALGESARQAFEELRDALERGQVRAAEPGPDGWQVNAWVKQGLLLGFRLGRVLDLDPAGPLTFRDKETFPPRRFTAEDGVRVVPGGSAVRRGAYVAPGVVIMPPAYVNVGAYVGAGSMVDSHALVGSCAQVGQRVHLSAGAMLGGVLEPVGAWPVIVEDEVLIGGNCGVYEGTQVGRRAVLAAGVILTRAMSLYDLPRGAVHRATASAPLRVPAGAVVVPGVRRAGTDAGAAFAERHGLGLLTPVIVKYRDDKTDAATALEEALR